MNTVALWNAARSSKLSAVLHLLPHALLTSLSLCLRAVACPRGASRRTVRLGFWLRFHHPVAQLSRGKTAIAVLLALLLSSGLMPSSLAQTAGTGALAGEVTDSTHAVVPDVHITVVNEATGEKRVVSSHADGSYIAPLLLPGSYRVEFSKSGFKTVVENGLKINVTETAKLNAQLTVGTVQQEVSVAAQKELMETESASLGQA